MDFRPNAGVAICITGPIKTPDRQPKGGTRTAAVCRKTRRQVSTKCEKLTNANADRSDAKELLAGGGKAVP
jgi:N-acetylneuraminic acid mutarotase